MERESIEKKGGGDRTAREASAGARVSKAALYIGVFVEPEKSLEARSDFFLCCLVDESQSLLTREAW